MTTEELIQKLKEGITDEQVELQRTSVTRQIVESNETI